MACMEHRCFLCNHLWFDNSTAHECPKCGCDNVSNWFDEYPELPPRDDFDEHGFTSAYEATEADDER